MRLTDYTDYTLRVLMFCALHPERSVTIAELADSHAVCTPAASTGRWMHSLRYGC